MRERCAGGGSADLADPLDQVLGRAFYLGNVHVRRLFQDMDVTTFATHWQARVHHCQAR